MLRILRALFNRLFRRKEIELTLKRFEANGERWDLTLSHPLFESVAVEFTQLFADLKIRNYLEAKVFDPATITMYTFTIRKAESPTLGMINTDLRDALLEIRKYCDDVDVVVRVAEEVLQKYGYLNQEQ